MPHKAWKSILVWQQWYMSNDDQNIHGLIYSSCLDEIYEFKTYRLSFYTEISLLFKSVLLKKIILARGNTRTENNLNS